MLNPPPSNHHESTRPPTLAFTNDANPYQGFSRNFSPALHNKNTITVQLSSFS